MHYSCKNKCKPYTVHHNVKGNHRYAAGQKRCNECRVFMICDGIYCPCCGHKLRTKPRNSNNRKQYEMTNPVKRI